MCLELLKTTEEDLGFSPESFSSSKFLWCISWEATGNDSSPWVLASSTGSTVWTTWFECWPSLMLTILDSCGMVQGIEDWSLLLCIQIKKHFNYTDGQSPSLSCELKVKSRRGHFEIHLSLLLYLSKQWANVFFATYTQGESIVIKRSSVSSGSGSSHQSWGMSGKNSLKLRAAACEDTHAQRLLDDNGLHPSEPVHWKYHK